MFVIEIYTNNIVCSLYDALMNHGKTNLSERVFYKTTEKCWNGFTTKSADYWESLKMGKGVVWSNDFRIVSTGLDDS